MQPTSTQVSRRFGRGIAWNIIATAATNGANLVTAVILANMLGREVFGEFGIVQSTIVSVGGIAQIAMGLTTTKYVAQYREESKDSAGQVLGLCAVVTAFTGGIGAMVMFLGAPFLANELLGVPSLTGTLAWAAGVVIFATMNGFQMGALVGLEDYRSIAIISVAHAMLHVVICWITASMGGLKSVVIGLIISAALRWILFNIAVTREAQRQEIKIDIKGVGRVSSVLVRFAMPSALAGLSALLAIWTGNAILVRQDNGLGQMGLYAAVNSLRALMLFFPAVVNNVGVSVINSFSNLRNVTQFRTAFWGNFWVTFASLAIGATIVFFFGQTLLGLFGRDFVGAGALLNVVILGVVMEGLSVAAYQLVQSRARMWTSLLLVSLPRDCLLVACAWFLVARYGALGLAVGYALSWCVALLMIFLITAKLGVGPVPDDKGYHALVREEA